VALAEARDRLRLEVREPAAEALALAQDRQPREAGLEALEAEPLVEAALVRHRPAPLLVVVGDVQRVGRRPAALRQRSAGRRRPRSRPDTSRPAPTPAASAAAPLRARTQSRGGDRRPCT